MTPTTTVVRGPALEALVERHLPDLTLSDDSLKTALPGVARDAARDSARVAAAVEEVPSDHRILQGDARNLATLDDGSVHLVVTSPPYWTRALTTSSSSSCRGSRADTGARLPPRVC